MPTHPKLWAAIREGADAIASENHERFVADGARGAEPGYPELRECTAAFLAQVVDDSGAPQVELIWSYWHDRAMLVRTFDAVLARFQDRVFGPSRDPLAGLDLDPLRPLADLFRGWTEDERTTVTRRSSGYARRYSVELATRIVPSDPFRAGRPRFIESFHQLLSACHAFFDEDDDTTLLADGFPVLDALGETNQLLADAAHNSLGDLTVTARSEMLIMQWLLGRPAAQAYLGVAPEAQHDERWMDTVERMKELQGWAGADVGHFREMAVCGEQIVLAVRHGGWEDIHDPRDGAAWARDWRPEISRYIRSHRAVSAGPVADGPASRAGHWPTLPS